MDSRTQLDFVPLIYQERSSKETHHLVVFDVNRMEISRHYSLLSNVTIRDHLRHTAAGFGCYTLTRTSDVFSQTQGMFLSHTCNGNHSEQVAKYQVSTQYYMKNVRLPDQYDDLNPESGLSPAQCAIECQEFGIHFSCCG